MSWGGHEAGEATAAPVTEPQWPAVSTVVGEISVPVHRKAPKVISATAGNSFGAGVRAADDGGRRSGREGEDGGDDREQREGPS